jgi:hypothetical protein
MGVGLDGSGTEAAVPSPYIERVGTDIYGARHVAIIGGGHHLPFADGAFDGVWIQCRVFSRTTC